MMKAIHHLLTAAVLLTAGVLLGRGLFDQERPAIVLSHEGPDGRQQHRQRDGGPGRRAATIPPAADDDPHDLKGLKARYQKWAANASGQRAELERLSVPALRELILTQLAEMGKGARGPDSAARHGVMRAALAELYRREGTAVLEWVAGLERGEQGTARKQAMAEILRISLREHPEAAKPWLDRYHEEYGKDMLSSGFVSEAMRGAISRGAEDVIRIQQLFGAAATSNALVGAGWAFPDGFDFAKLHAALAGQVDLTRTVKHWAARDADAAWQAVKTDVTTGGQGASRTYGSLVAGVIAKEGEAAAVKWGIARLDELPPEQRSACLRELVNEGRLTPDGIAAAMDLLPPADRRELTARLISQYNAQEKAITALGKLAREDLIATLEDGARKHKTILNGDGADTYQTSLRRLYQDAETRFALTPAESARLQAARQ